MTAPESCPALPTHARTARTLARIRAAGRAALSALGWPFSPERPAWVRFPAAALLLAAVCGWAASRSSWPAAVAGAAAILVVIAAHEAGHLIAARRLGLTPREFAIGFGPAVASARRRGLRWSLRALPIGGYVATTEGINAMSPRARFWFAAAGPAASLVTGVVLIAAGEWLAGSGDPEAFVTGVQGALVFVTRAPGAVWSAVASETMLTKATGAAGMVAGVGTAFAGAAAAKVFIVTGLFSIVIGVLNLLPFPGLDGWHMLVPACETLTRRRVAAALERPVLYAGAACMASLFLWGSVRDVITR